MGQGVVKCQQDNWQFAHFEPQRSEVSSTVSPKSQLKDLHPNDNTMAAEQTLVWLSRFKKIVCAMPKVHHLFYLHRMVRRRNAYTVHCYKKGHKPVLPKSRQWTSGRHIYFVVTLLRAEDYQVYWWMEENANLLNYASQISVDSISCKWKGIFPWSHWPFSVLL